MRLVAIAFASVLTLLSVWGASTLLGFGEFRLADRPASHYFPDDKVEMLARAAAEGDIPAMKEAVAAGVDVNAVGFEGIRPLFWALFARNKEGFETLLDFGADPYLEAKDSFSLVNLTAGADDPEYLRILLNHGLDPNVAVGHEEKPPIFEAIMQHRWPQLELLLEHCYNLNWVNDYGKTAALEAASISDIKTAHYLVEQGLTHYLSLLAQYIEQDTTNPPEQAEYREKLIRLLEDEHDLSFPVPPREPGTVNPPPSPPAYAKSCLDRRARLGLGPPGPSSN